MKKFYSILTRKSIDESELKSATKSLIYDFHTQPEEYTVNTIIELPFTQFCIFSQNLLGDYDFIKNNKDLKEHEALLVKAIGTSDDHGILVVTAGFDYARFTGIVSLKPHTCSRCGKKFLEPPAISRKDNFSPVCSKCGQEQAIEIFKKFSDDDFSKAIAQMQDICNRFRLNIDIFDADSNTHPIILEAK